MRPSNTNKQAFTLLEVMIALTVLSIGMFAVFSAMGVSVNVARTVSEQELVSQAIENRMEEMQAAVWSGIMEDYMGDTDVAGVQAINTTDQILKTTISFWDNTDKVFVEQVDPRTIANWSSYTEAEKEQEWDAIKPGDFHILLISIRADWAGAVGNQTASMEFILVDRDGVGN